MIFVLINELIIDHGIPLVPALEAWTVLSTLVLLTNCTLALTAPDAGPPSLCALASNGQESVL